MATNTARVEVEWTRANLAEVLPELTSPQALTAFEEILNVAQRRSIGPLLAPESVLGPMVKSFYGRPYFNLAQLRHAVRALGGPPASSLRSLGHPEQIRPEDEQATPVSLGARLRTAPVIFRILSRHLRAKQLLKAHDEAELALRQRFTAVDPATLSDREVLSMLEEWIRVVPERIQIVLMFAQVVTFEDQLKNICLKIGIPFESFLFTQLAAGERSISARQAFDLVDLARIAREDRHVVGALSADPLDVAELKRRLAGTAFWKAFDRFLEIYGHRGLYESDWALPRYSEDPTPLLRAVRAHLHDFPSADASNSPERQAEKAATAWADFERRLSPVQRWTFLTRTRQLVRRIKQYYLWREHCRFEMTRTLAEARRWHLVLANRFVERGWLDTRQHYFLLHLSEVAQAVAHGSSAVNFREIVSARLAEAERYRRIEMPLLLREAELPELVKQAAPRESVAEVDGDLRGITTSAGCVEAEVAVIHDPGDFATMKRGAILVARATDPSWTPLFTLASGVIVEVGGVLSHASTVAREFGLPALANVKHATRRLRSGERVVLNATDGYVRRIGT